MDRRAHESDARSDPENYAVIWNVRFEPDRIDAYSSVYSADTESDLTIFSDGIEY